MAELPDVHSVHAMVVKLMKLKADLIAAGVLKPPAPPEPPAEAKAEEKSEKPKE